MCLCSKVNKILSPNGLYQGRVLQPAKVNYSNQAPRPVKKSPIIKYGTKK